MEPIVLTCGNQTVQFTNTEINVDGTVWPYNGITRIWHVPEKSAYALQCNGQMMAIPYDAQNASLMQTLFDHIAQARNLQVEEYRPSVKTAPKAEEQQADPDHSAATHPESAEFEPTGGIEPANSVSSEPETTEPEAPEPEALKPETLETPAEEVTTEIPPAKENPPGGERPSGDRRFMIEMVIGILLIVAGVVGFILIK